MSRQLHVTSGRDLGPQFVDNPHRMVGQDGAYSIPIENGSFWFFGDTLIGQRTPGESLWFPGGEQLGPGDMSGRHGIDLMRTNTGLILEDSTGAGGLRKYRYVLDEKGQPAQIVPHLPGENRDELRVWCLHGVVIGKDLYLYYIVVRMLASGPMPVNFELVGCGLAKGLPDGTGFQRLLVEGESLWWRWPLPQFGTTVLKGRDDGLLYIYGVGKDGAGRQECCIARVPVSQLEVPGAYRYWNGTGWEADPHCCAPIMTGAPNEMSVSWNDYLGCYLAVHSYELSGRIVGRTASQPWGPWGDPVTLWKVTPPRYGYHVPYAPLIYAGKEHPELSGEAGRVLYLTYIEFEEYFPHLIEITLG